MRNPKNSWSKERIVAEFQALAADGCDMKRSSIEAIRPELSAAARRIFGSIGAAISAAGLQGSRRKWSQAAILRGIQHAATVGVRMNQSSLKRYDYALLDAAQRYFGTAREAIVAAGLEYYSPTRAWTPESVITSLQDAARSGIAISYTTLKKHDAGLVSGADRLFGSLELAVGAAGLRYEKSRERWSPGRVIRDLKRFASKGVPMQSTYIHDEYPCLAKAARKYFGSVQNAIEAAGLIYQKKAESPVEPALVRPRTVIAVADEYRQKYRTAAGNGKRPKCGYF